MNQEKIKYFILSLSGGGIRGILSAKVLAYIQNKIEEKMEKGRVFHFTEKVDLFAGTSTGSILALALNVKDLEIENILHHFFQNNTIADTYSKVIIPAHNITQEDPDRVLYFFKTTSAISSDRNFFMKDVIRASTAAPTYFAPANIRRVNSNKEYVGEEMGFIDDC
jgi:patatin-like phospholipase/acyl hydrolase